MKILKILIVILALLLGFAHFTRAQSDTTRTPIGYDIDYAFVYARKDTVHCMTQLYNHYPHKMYFSVNGGRAMELKRGQVMTVWSCRFALTVTRKNYKHTYTF
jgi:hypothetical protein